jgi:acyl-homoserine lactone synthase
MFRLRHEVFVEECARTTPNEAPLDRDQFDNETAIYFLYLDEDGEMAASFRILPTTGPHIMSEKFSHLCVEGIPVADGIFEGSKAVVREKYRKGGAVWQSIMAGVFEYCLMCGIEGLTSVVGLRLFMDRLRHDVDFRPLGPPTEVDGEQCIALYRPVTVESLQVMRKRLGLQGPVLTWIGDLKRVA